MTAVDAADKKAMTVAELREFLASVDGIPDDAVPRVRIAYGGKIKSIRVEETR